MNIGGIGGIPVAGHVLPLVVEAEHRLKRSPEPLRPGDLESAVDELAPGVVGLLVDDAPVGIDGAEADERLARTVRIDAVHIGQGVGLGVAAMDERDVERELLGELLPETEDVLVDERLGRVRVELDGRIELPG